MRQNRWNCSTGVIEVNYPMTMTADDVQDFKDSMAIVFRILDRTALSTEINSDLAEALTRDEPRNDLQLETKHCGKKDLAMGVSSDGMLYFGFQVGGDDEKPEWLEGFEDFDDYLVAKAGLSEDSPYEERSKIIKACPAELQLFCSYDYPMYVLGVRGAEHRANRGYIVEIGAKELAVDNDKIAAFNAWCTSQNIEWHEPRWLLCSMYG